MMLDFETAQQTFGGAQTLDYSQNGSNSVRVTPRRPKSLTMRQAVAIAHGSLQPIGEDMKNIFADIFDRPATGERTVSATDLRAMLARRRLAKRPAAAQAGEPAAKDEERPAPSTALTPAPAPEMDAVGAQLATLRDSLDSPPEPQDAPPASLPMFLAIHAMNLVLLVIFAPIGLALTLFALIKGPDLRLTANSLVMTGLLLSYGQIASVAMA